MKNILFIFLLIGLYNCQSKIGKETSSSIMLDDIISEVDSIKSFNGIVGILNKEKEPQVVYHGFKSPQNRKFPLDSTDYFHLASNSKLFAGFATLKVMEDFDLKYDDSIAPYFPELRSALQRVTIQELANHTCGIHDYFSLIEEPLEVTNEQALKLMTELDSTVYEPGTRWGYTNSGYVLLSLLVERVSGENYNSYLRQKILAPLDIHNAQLYPNKINALNGFENDQRSKTFSITTGDTGIFLSSQDLIRFFQNQDKMSDFILKAENWSSPWKEEQWRYGFGWFFSEDALGKFRAHSGKSGGFESYIRISQENDQMIFILSNNVNGSAKLLRERITEALITTAQDKVNDQ